MPSFIQKNIWLDSANLDYVCITTNSMVKKDKTLCMGAGNAKQAKMLIPSLPFDFGQKILEKNLNLAYYGLLLAQDKYIAFQTKIHWKDESPLWVIQSSCEMLKRLALKYPERTFGLPFPGINNGKRTKEEVFPLLENLPSNVYIYSLN